MLEKLREPCPKSFVEILTAVGRGRQSNTMAKGDATDNPNGLTIVKDGLYVSTWGLSPDPKTYATKVPGKLIKINTRNQTVQNVISSLGNLDGLSETLHGFLLTDWVAGKLWYYSNADKSVKEVLDLPQGSADIYFDKATKTLYIPSMADGKLLSYQFKK